MSNVIQLQMNAGEPLTIRVINTFDDEGCFAGYKLEEIAGLPQPKGVFWTRTDIWDWLNRLGIEVYELVQECDEEGIPLVRY